MFHYNRIDILTFLFRFRHTHENASKPTDNQTVLDKKKYEDEIARLRGENELLKAILIKNGINYVKERTSFKFNEFS